MSDHGNAICVYESPEEAIGRGRLVAEFGYYYRGHAKAVADARLFLAAPALLAFAESSSAYNEYREGRLTQEDFVAVLRRHGWTGTLNDLGPYLGTPVISISEFLIALRDAGLKMARGEEVGR
jgi:hypothetical protein